MIAPLSRQSAAILLLSVTGTLASAAARGQSADASPVPPLVAPADPVRPAEPVTPAARHLAPRGTFYLLDYVSATTDSGVIGFVPGQEVHLLQVDEPAQTLVVTDGKHQVSVPPSKLTNDVDIANLVRRQDQANQARVADYVRAEEAAYAKQQRENAELTAKADEQQREERVAERQAAVQAQVETREGAGGSTEAAGPAAATGYYGLGGDGYGSPYSYFVLSGANRRINGASGPGGGRGTLPSSNGGGASRPNQIGSATGSGGAARAGAGSAGGSGESRQGTGGRP